MAEAVGKNEILYCLQICIVLAHSVLVSWTDKKLAVCQKTGDVAVLLLSERKLMILQLFNLPGNVRTPFLLTFQLFLLEVAQGLDEHTEGRGQDRLDLALYHG